MFKIIQAHEYAEFPALMAAMFRLRKSVFHDKLKWAVQVDGDMERDVYDTMGPAYLVWCDAAQTKLYGMIRLMPTTGPTLLYDVFRRTFPDDVDLVAPGIWEGTRMCLDEAAIAQDYPSLEPVYCFCTMLLALCECAMHYGIHAMISNYEPHLRRVYRRAGLDVQELGRADGYGLHPVCCGLFDVSEPVLRKMRTALKMEAPLFHVPAATRATTLQRAA